MDNLLSNARHATPAGGQITVRVADLAAEVQVEVTDSGTGVPEPDRERIFERFTRLAGTYSGERDGSAPGRSASGGSAPGGSAPDHRASDGSELGLAIARGIARAHAGSLTCTDSAGGGARFLLRLPRPGGCGPARG